MESELKFPFEGFRCRVNNCGYRAQEPKTCVVSSLSKLVVESPSPAILV